MQSWNAKPLIINAQGNNVGIGTTTPNNLIQVAGLINFEPTLHDTLLGDSAGSSITSGTYSTGVGYHALFNNSTGSWNTALGAFALAANTSTENTAIGYAALQSNVGGNLNTAVGFAALNANTGGGQNTAVGYSALGSGSSGVQNTAMGYFALDNSTGNSNTAIGFRAGSGNTIGTGNVFLGRFAGRYQTTADNQLFINNQDRFSAAADITDSLIYGVFDSVPSNQILTLNAKVGINMAPSGGSALDVNGFIRTSGGGSGIVGDDSSGLQLFAATGHTVAMTINTADRIHIQALPIFTDDTAAGAGGLVAGDLYQTNGSGAITTPGVVMIKQ